jgi:hypothetical protein
MNKRTFTDFDFSSLDSPEFKEDSVREDLIMPILKELGYSSQSENKIIRSKKVKHPSKFEKSRNEIEFDYLSIKPLNQNQNICL